MYSAFRLALLLFVVIIPLTLSAQTNFPLMTAKERTLLSFQFQHPFFKSGTTDFTLLSGTYDLTLVAPVNRTLSIVGTLPYAAYATSSKFYSESASALANISIGVNKSFESGTSMLTGKVFLPTAPSDGANASAALYGLFHHYYDLEQYLPEALGIQTRYYFQKNFNGLLLGGVIGGTALIPTGNGFEEVEVLARYGVSGGYESKDFRAVIEFVGIGIVTEGDGIFSEGNTQHFITLGGQWTGGSVAKPRINVHIPLGDEISDIYGSALTLGCDFVFP